MFAFCIWFQVIDPSADYKKAIEETMREVQLWYACDLNGNTFRLNDTMVEVKDVDHNASWYNQNRPDGVTDPKLYTWHNAFNAAANVSGAKLDDPDYVWMIFIDAPGGTGTGLTSSGFG